MEGNVDGVFSSFPIARAKNRSVNLLRDAYGFAITVLMLLFDVGYLSLSNP